MEETLGQDMRMLMEAFPYETYLTRITKNLGRNIISQSHGDTFWKPCQII